MLHFRLASAIALDCTYLLIIGMHFYSYKQGSCQTYGDVKENLTNEKHIN